MKCRIVLVAALALAGCGKPAAEDPGTAVLPSDAAQAAAAASEAVTAAPNASATPAPTPAPAASPAPTPSPIGAPEAPSNSLDPGQVVVAWAKAMSLKQWGLAYRYWGDEGMRSGLTLLQFTEKWGRLRNPEFELHPGTTEGAAGSSYYTAPIVLIDGKRTVRGKIVLKRVNDIDGATPEQLRWHIESLSIAP